MKDTRDFLTKGFRGRNTVRAVPNAYSISCNSWIECSKGGPWKVTKDPVTGKITKEKLSKAKEVNNG